MYVHEHMWVTVCVWRSGDNFVESFLSFHLYIVMHWTQVVRLASSGSKRTSHLSSSVRFLLQTVVWVCTSFCLSGIGHLGLLWVILLWIPIHTFHVKIMTPCFVFYFLYILKSRIGWWFGNLCLTLGRADKLFDSNSCTMCLTAVAVNEGVCSLGACQCLLFIIWLQTLDST